MTLLGFSDQTAVKFEGKKGHFSQEKPFESIICNIGSDNGLVPDSNKPLPEQMLQNLSHFVQA